METTQDRAAHPAMETCENCGRAIGKLETPWLHGEHAVCRECWDRLSVANSAAASPQPPTHLSSPPPQPNSQVVRSHPTADWGKSVGAAIALLWNAFTYLAGAFMLLAAGASFANSRFQNDNAIGATANSAERMEGLALAVVGLLFIFLARFDDTLRRLGNAVTVINRGE